MEIISILLISVGLSMDSLAISIATACSCENKTKFTNLRFALILAFVQAICIVVGWLAGSSLTKMFQQYYHWIAFALLTIIGGKMLIDGIRKRDNTAEINMNNFFVVVGLGIATSIDAVVVGVSLPFAGINIWLTALIVFFTTFTLSYLGLISGNFLRKKFKRLPVEIIGGLFLIGIGIKVLLEHLINGC